MPLPLRKRTVHFYEIHVHSRTLSTVQNPSCANFSDLLNCFALMARGRGLPKTIRKSTALHTVLADWNYDQANNCYELLLSKANSALSDVALRDLQTSKVRKAGKTKVEGIELSAHVLIRPNSDGKTALMLLTMQAHVVPKDVEMLLKGLSRMAAKLAANKRLFYFDDPSGAKAPDGTAVQYKVSYGFAAFAHQGQTLTQALANGEFEGLELIEKSDEKFDTGGNLKLKERILRVDAVLPKTVTGAAIRNAVSAYLKLPGAADYRKLRIYYKTPAGKSTSATLDTNHLDAAFTLKEQIEFATDVDAQQDKLSSTIISGMKPLLQLVP